MVAPIDEQAFREFEDTVHRVAGIAAQKAMETMHAQSKLCGTPNEQTAVIGEAITLLAVRYILASKEAGMPDSAVLFANMTGKAMIRAIMS